jgi:hypothetical protein
MLNHSSEIVKQQVQDFKASILLISSKQWDLLMS